MHLAPVMQLSFPDDSWPAPVLFLISLQMKKKKKKQWRRPALHLSPFGLFVDLQPFDCTSLS